MTPRELKTKEQIEALAEFEAGGLVGGERVEFISGFIRAYNLATLPQPEEKEDEGDMELFAQFLKQYTGIRDFATPEYAVKSFFTHKKNGTLDLKPAEQSPEREEDVNEAMSERPMSQKQFDVISVFKEGNEGLPFRMIIDNLTGEQIIDYVLEYASRSQEKREIKLPSGDEISDWWDKQPENHGDLMTLINFMNWIKANFN